jgi:ribosome-associated protein
MDIRKLQRAIVDGLEDVKGQNIVVFNTEHLSALFERVIIASGTSNRQTKALASSVRDAVKGLAASRTEGEANGEWIIVDCGAAVVHLMQPAIREYYHLEEIWGDKPVKMKLDDKPARLVKAAEAPQPAPAKKVVAKKAAARKTAAEKVPSTSPAAKKTIAKAPAAKAAAKKSPARKAPLPARAGVTRTVGVKSTAGKAAPAKKVPARKAAAKKSPSRA